MLNFFSSQGLTEGSLSSREVIEPSFVVSQQRCEYNASGNGQRIVRAPAEKDGKSSIDSTFDHTNYISLRLFTRDECKDKIPKVYTFLRLFLLFMFDRATGDLLIAVPYISETSWKVLTINIFLNSSNEEPDHGNI